MKYFSRHLLTGGVVTTVLFSVVSFFSPNIFAATTPSSNLCLQENLSVSLGENLPKNQTIVGTLCFPNGPKPTTIDVLVHGATYNSTYWNLPSSFSQYSYVVRTTKEGRATFNYDRLGAGKSSRPVSTDVTLDADAYVLHQIIEWLHNANHYREINVIGHSFGAAVAIAESAKYNDADRLVVTGFMHSTGPALSNGEFQVYPADQDPQFAGKGYDTGYVTTIPNIRGNIFYTSAASSTVISYDENHKDVVSSTQRGQGTVQRTAPAGSNATNSIKLPVIVVEGQNDRLYCGTQLDCTNTTAAKAFETPFYTSAKSFTLETVASTGHVVALHPSNGVSFQKINQWLKTTPAYH